MSVTKTKNVFITGGNRGIGLELCKRIAEKFRPEHLFVTFRKLDQAKELHDLQKEYSCIHPVQLDVADYKQYADIVTQVDKMTGGAGINLLINNAGIMSDKAGQQSFGNVDGAICVEHFNINSIAPILLTQAFVPLLKKGANANPSLPLGIGRAVVVNISSLMGSVADNKFGGYYAYRMSKAALNMGTKSLSIDLKGDNILSFVLHPGWVQTDMGGKSATLTIGESVNGIFKVIDSVDESYNGKFWNFDGKELPW